MDFVREACHFSKLDHLEKQNLRETFLLGSNPTDDILESLFHRGSGSTAWRGNTLIYDVIRMSFKTMSGVQRSELEPFTSLVKYVCDIIWYISPHTIKFHNNGFSIPRLCI